MAAYKKVYPNHDLESIEREAKEYFATMDTDGNGSVDFSEWCAATINKRTLLNEKNLAAAFALFDKD